MFDAIRTVVAFSGQSKESARYAENLGEARKTNIKKGFWSGIGFGMLWFFIYASYALSFWYGVGLVANQIGWEPQDRNYDAGVMFTVYIKYTWENNQIFQ